MIKHTTVIVNKEISKTRIPGDKSPLGRSRSYSCTDYVVTQPKPKLWTQKLYSVLYIEARDRNVPEAHRSQYVRERIAYLILLTWNLDENERMLLTRHFTPATCQSLETHDDKIKVCMLACEELSIKYTDIKLERFDKIFMIRSRKELELEQSVLASLYEYQPLVDISEVCFIKLLGVCKGLTLN